MTTEVVGGGEAHFPDRVGGGEAHFPDRGRHLAGKSGPLRRWREERQGGREDKARTGGLRRTDAPTGKPGAKRAEGGKLVAKKAEGEKLDDPVVKKKQPEGMGRLRTGFAKSLGARLEPERFSVLLYSRLPLLRCVRELKGALRALNYDFEFDRTAVKLRIKAKLRDGILLAGMAFEWAERRTVRIEIKQSRDDPREIDWKSFTQFYKSVMLEFMKVSPGAIIKVVPSRDSNERSR